MIFWYRNSFLASIISIAGCLMMVSSIGMLVDHAGETGELIFMLVAGLALAVCGRLISQRKAEKKAAKLKEQQENQM